MSLKYELLKCLVKAAGIKKHWVGMSTEELLENRRRQNAKNRIPDLRDDAFEISSIDVMGFPVLKLIHKEHSDRATLFLIGGGMVSAPRPGSVKKALRIAKETGLDLFIPYYPLCTDYPLTKAYEMIHETYKVMLQSYRAENISVPGTSSDGNLALGMLVAPNFVEHKGTLGSRIWSGILQIAGVCFEQQWSAQEFLDFLADNGWHVTFSKEMAARIAMMYTECERKA